MSKKGSIYRQENEAFLKEDGNATIGRVVTAKSVRGTGLGKLLMEEAIASAKAMFTGRRCVIHAQCYAIGFYEKCGFQVCSDEFLEVRSITAETWKMSIRNISRAPAVSRISQKNTGGQSDAHAPEVHHSQPA